MNGFLLNLFLALINLHDVRNDLIKNWEKALEISLFYDHHDSEKKQSILKEINEYYFKNRKLLPETYQNLTNVSK